MGFASTAFSAGIGPMWESQYPYKASDGSDSTAADWTLPESDRFGTAFELENSYFLPSPATTDSEGNYVYSEMGTEAIKQELLAGRGVSISYHADQSMDPAAAYNMMADKALSLGVPQEMIDLYRPYALGEIPQEELTPEASEAGVCIFIVYMTGMTYEEYTEWMAENKEDLASQLAAASAETAVDPETAAAQAAALEAQSRAAAEKMGIDYDALIAHISVVQEANAGLYMNTDTYAQYVDNINASKNHGVCIVGWDDNYDVSNFPADHRPPANGAWIVRNSWGSQYGNDGYFYLSYYDQTISSVESFDFVLNETSDGVSAVDILAYDMMPAATVDSIKMDEATYMANVFTVEAEEVLDSVSIMTGARDTNVTIAVYMLNEDAETPVDGIMLDSVTKTFEFAGYHRVKETAA